MVEFKSMDEMVNYAKEKVLEYMTDNPNSPYLYFWFYYNHTQEDKFDLIENLSESKEGRGTFVIKSKGKTKEGEAIDIIQHWDEYKEVIKIMLSDRFVPLSPWDNGQWWTSTQALQLQEQAFMRMNQFWGYNPFYDPFHLRIG